VTGGRLAALVVLVLIVALFAVAILLGATRGSGGGLSGTPVDALSGLLVRPASLSDLAPQQPECVRGQRLVVAQAQPCVYDLVSGFLAKRIRLRVAGPGTVTGVLAQPNPQVSDRKTLSAGDDPAEFVYRQDHSTLTVACAGAPACQLSLG
jgi:hypothetical protein